MDRRKFIAASLATAAATVAGPAVLAQEPKSSGSAAKFKLNYAPHLGMFKGHAGSDAIDQVTFMADQGFAAMEDNGMMKKPVELQEKIALKMSSLGMKMGVFVAYAEFGEPTFVRKDLSVREMLTAQLKEAVEVAKRVNARWVTVVPGAYDKKLNWDYQTVNVIENLKHCAGVCEPSGLVMVLEPLNPYVNHPGLFLAKIPQAYQICRAVDSPSCKILNDLYHQQVTEGNLINNIDAAWDQIAYIQVGDNPGRKEPGTGEINYRNIFKHLHGKNYKGIIGMEHGNSAKGLDGEKMVIKAYRKADDFTAGRT